ncbi:hypothetical protein GT370_16205 [Acidocella sp. MX-AZ03]|uniref:hypothetical protein n=1 Tax=Acidocella sp. MX-AZ03 TaxID=2697363 RepID=UPI0022DE4937|nr:hypothetical protein [Acidocella sp. MX-AZ03]WBO58674.1 hypothetical protein GT370_16205 [Acidocella sp. MX-AZ03]
MHAPTYGDWGHDNRMASVRVITADPAASRIEHRVAGADCNPYLSFASLLGTALAGLEGRMDPGPETHGTIRSPLAPPLPIAWSGAVDKFGASAAMGDIFGRSSSAITPPPSARRSASCASGSPMWNMTPI